MTLQWVNHRCTSCSEIDKLPVPQEIDRYVCTWCVQAAQLADFVNRSKPSARNPQGHPDMQPWQVLVMSQWLRAHQPGK